MARVWYHGGPEITDWENLRWDRERNTSDGNAEGPGMYWTSDLDEAATYGRYLYGATMRPEFRKLAQRRTISTRALRDLYQLAEEQHQETFLSNWNIEWPAFPREIDTALAHYSHQNSIFDAYVTLYHDLFQYDADEYVSAMVSLGWDGHVVLKGTTGGSRRRDHLIVWNPRALIVTELG